MVNYFNYTQVYNYREVSLHAGHRWQGHVACARPKPKTWMNSAKAWLPALDAGWRELHRALESNSSGKQTMKALFAILIFCLLGAVFAQSIHAATPISRDLPSGLQIPDAARPGPNFDVDRATEAYFEFALARTARTIQRLFRRRLLAAIVGIHLRARRCRATAVGRHLATFSRSRPAPVAAPVAGDVGLCSVVRSRRRLR